jgi:lipopolysaccharide export system permease protein
VALGLQKGWCNALYLPRMKILDWYIIKKFIGSYVFAIGIFVAISVVFDLTEKIDGMLQRSAPLNEIVFDYYVNFIPYYANLFSPLFTFITVIFFTSKLAAKSEFVAILSSGVEFRRILLPYMMAAALIGLTNWFLASWVLPPANKTRIAFENKYIRDTFYFNKRNIHFQLEPGVLAYLETYSSPDSAGFRFSLEDLRTGSLSSKLMCDRIVWRSETQSWYLEGCLLREIEGELNERISFIQHIDTVLAFSPVDFSRPLVEDAALLNNRELNELIARERLKGNAGIEPYLLEKYNRISIPFAAFILTLMGVSLSSRKVRGGIGLQLGMGVGLCFIYIMMIRFSLTFAIKGSMPPVLASWTPNIIFGFLALYLYRVAPK